MRRRSWRPPGRTPRSSSSRAPWSPTSRAGTNRPSPAGHRRRDGTSWPPGRRCRVGAETAAATPAAPSPPTVPPAPCERCHIGRWRCRYGASRSNSSNSSSGRASQPGTCSTQDRSSSACQSAGRRKVGRVVSSGVKQRRLPGNRRDASAHAACAGPGRLAPAGMSSPYAGRGAGCSTRARTRLAINRAVRTGVPPRVNSVTSTTPRPVRTSTRRPARVAATS